MYGYLEQRRLESRLILTATNVVVANNKTQLCPINNLEHLAILLSGHQTQWSDNQYIYEGWNSVCCGSDWGG